MRVSPRSAVPIAAMALWCALATTLDADPQMRFPLGSIDVLGRVIGPGQQGVEGARVVLEGAREVSATTDADGRYTLTVPLDVLGDPMRRSVTARIVAQRPGWTFALRNGQAALALELRGDARAEPPRCRVRANLTAPVDALSASIRRGDRSAVIANVDFVGAEGRQRVARVALRSEAVTVVGEALGPGPVAAVSPAPAVETRDDAAAAPQGARDDGRPIAAEPSKPAAALPPRAESGTPARAERRDAGAARRDRPSSPPRVRRIEAQRPARDTAAAQPDAGSITLPGPGVTQTDAALIRRVESAPGAADLPEAPLRADAVLAREGDCACRIRGTIEMHPDHLLTRRLDLVVALREAPAVRDTIQLFMGSPRAFELAAVRCGTWHIEVDAVARRDFKIVSADGRGPIDCREGGLRQLRVVLDPN